ncbi:HK97 gp10 family phage protein [Escherichia coli]|uniref:HK97 gp10 family phage protein n=1 Tax=Escherichia coli TaxID=562 RepID=UPI000BE43775|nr:HK97 gp10 family phage protein [Escherichia coli]EES8118160.1 HK97 gp10 family phage protein [Escherichia coli]EFF9100757.1 HK97 gp10 family phage protein [Escherichia coli]EHK6137188.1 HK97 gp10 family phage protein [Escherichia coli]EHW6699259.1 HK97 gp10 family phage protein [Escherichia coli]EIN0392061.1 HK97 gp10 family phage protein [Escherichia coli]
MSLKHKAIIERLKRRLREEINEINRDASAAAYAIGVSVEGYAKLLTPADTGALVNGYYVEVSHDSEGAHCEVGNMLRYAKWVHDMPGTLKGQPRADFGKTNNLSDFGPKQVVSFGGGTGEGCYWDPNAEPEFLRKALEDNRAEYMEIAKRYLQRGR